MEERVTQSVNESVNDKGACRTAPATPGLLIIWSGCSQTFLRYLGNRRETVFAALFFWSPPKNIEKMNLCVKNQGLDNPSH